MTMSPDAALQSRFVTSLRDPSAELPHDLALSGGRAPQKRFGVYRNNVAVSLIAAIEARFPACRRIVGDDFFRGLARSYAATHLPRSPLMMTYGDDFAAFLEGVAALDELPYLAGVARLEAARTRAYHAADVDPLGAAAFAAIDPKHLDALIVTLHPSLETVSSDHPIVTIWAMNAGEAPLGIIEHWAPEDALIARPALDVVVRRLAPGGAVFLRALTRGFALGDAAEAGLDADPLFDLTLNLMGLIEAGLAVGLGAATSPETPR